MRAPCLSSSGVGHRQAWQCNTVGRSPSTRAHGRHPSPALNAKARVQRLQPARASVAVEKGTDLRVWNDKARAARTTHLEEQAMAALQAAVDNFERPAFPCALILGDVVILDLLHRLDLLASGRVPIIFVDTFHLFPETHQLLRKLEDKYGFKARVFQAEGFATKQDYQKAHGSDLYITDTDKYDQICKVEPFSRALRELNVDCMVNGRRRDHGFDRAHLEVFEDGTPVKCNPLAFWEFRDCFNYTDVNGLDIHPLHAEGFPSVGDVHSTVPVAKEKWFEYGGERSGRFQGFTNPDGSMKTECGIHVAR